MYVTIVFNVVTHDEARELLNHPRLAAAYDGHALRDLPETLRDRFASSIMQAMFTATDTNRRIPREELEHIAHEAYARADIMLKARNQDGRS